MFVVTGSTARKAPATITSVHSTSCVVTCSPMSSHEQNMLAMIEKDPSGASSDALA